MRILDLPGGHRTIIDDADWPLVEHLPLYLGNTGYVYYSAPSAEPGGRTNWTLHGLLMGCHSRKKHVDHVNGDKLDNRRSNLRLASPQLNQVNRKRLSANNTSGHRGIRHSPSASSRNPWRAEICVDGRRIHLGLFSTAEAAVAARVEAERLHYGEECPR